MTIPVTSTAAAGTSGTLAAPATPSTTETIARSNVGRVLEVFNGSGSTITVTFVDPGKTPAGNSGTQAGYPVAASARRRWRLMQTFVDENDQIQVTFSAVTSVTAEIIY